MLFRSNRLYYERRSKQYSGAVGVEKVRIITIPTQIRSFAAMFLDQPHKATEYYGTLVKEVGSRIFTEDHQLMPYYTSSYAYYRLEYFFRNGFLDKSCRKFRYHMLMLIRHLVIGDDLPKFNAKKLNGLCEKLNEAMANNTSALALCESALDILREEIVDFDDRDTTKRQPVTDRLIKAAGKKKSNSSPSAKMPPKQARTPGAGHA